MCLAIPGKIISIKENIATIDYGSEKREAMIVLGNFNKDDYVIVQGKIVIEKVPFKQVEAWLNLLKENGS
ncbi:HypC/HybG/HupF family hydrogenase formation chaperone [Candidatus Woesearchaeota archaeon]|nr:HypC/HybG/HupF family hydrogenase formation chaperone [Candidatus Woesearchaeota archaeon]